MFDLFGTGFPDIEMPSGSLRGLHLVVADIREAHAALADRGVEVSETVEYPQGIKYAYFADPDGNTWALQEMPPRQ